MERHRRNQYTDNKNTDPIPAFSPCKMNQALVVQGTTASSSSITGSIIAAGGLGVAAKVYTGDALTVEAGGANVVNAHLNNAAFDVRSTHATFAGSTVALKTTRAKNAAFKFLTATADSTLLFDIEGTGKTTIYEGGLHVVSGGATVQASVSRRWTLFEAKDSCALERLSCAEKGAANWHARFAVVSFPSFSSSCSALPCSPFGESLLLSSYSPLSPLPSPSPLFSARSCSLCASVLSSFFHASSLFSSQPTKPGPHHRRWWRDDPEWRSPCTSRRRYCGSRRCHRNRRRGIGHKLGGKRSGVLCLCELGVFRSHGCELFLFCTIPRFNIPL